jgi:DnaK suppressor protein
MKENTPTQEAVRYSDKDLAEFKILIKEKIEKAEHDLELIRSAYMNDKNNGTDDTSPTFKASEDTGKFASNEANAALAIRQEKYIRDLKNALIRVENKTYGVCRVSKSLIPKDRLKLVPHATLSASVKESANFGSNFRPRHTALNPRYMK